ARVRRRTARTRAEKLSHGIGGHFSPRDCCAASLALAAALFQAHDSAHQTTSGSVHEHCDVAISPVADERFARAQTIDPPGDTSPRQRTPRFDACARFAKRAERTARRTAPR